MGEARKVEKLQRPSAGVLDGLGAGESASARPERTAGPTGGRKSKNLGGRGCGAGRGAHPLRAPEARRRPARLPGGRPGRRKPAGGGRGAERACERVRGCGWRASVRGREGERAAGAPALPASRPPRLPPARAHRPPAAAAPARAGAAREPARRRLLCASLRRWDRPLPDRELFKRRECARFPPGLEDRGKEPATLPQTRLGQLEICHCTTCCD